MAASPLETVLTRDRLLVAASLAGLCLVSWLFLVHLALQMEAMDGMAGRMMGMDVEDALSARLAAAMGPAAAALADAAVNFTLVTLMWAVMMVGMMLPSAAPTILLFAALERKRAAEGRIGGRTAAFVAGYLAIWSVFSIVAAAAQTVLAHAGLVSMHLAATSTMLAGAIFIAAGLYELTPLKDRCLTHCRSPIEWLPRHIRPGRLGALRMGVEHGAYCVGCCWVLMLLLFVGGVMNLIWVAALAAIVLVQKLLPGGPILSRFTGAALVACGFALLAVPLLPV
ncbi:DUF2182 domain-containing protein [Chelativorans salis]|uniref:DUF2182 domain-containing protein n=1 Tax=Chelativorans salis TaxID=2978478 RepID=A0ABT2LH97_9HYPH|nr:DUF2182 domain-containing protein [Chelativorans sp. EGI FJ00035]MCT7373926.1 DUF2182 domain-containing protein [Chelativorans sp. EGI FJ00035]